jgi:hypothetical protein
MQTAFKEWAIIVDALGRGEQIVILRKGGISEDGGSFEVEHPKFWLYPTLFHQQGESVIDSAKARCEALLATMTDTTQVRIEYFAEVVDWRKLENAEDALALRGQHIWRDEVIRERFDWGRQKNIFALAVRVYRLPAPLELPVLASYGGCKSWIDLEPVIDTTKATPVLSDAEFATKFAAFRALFA